MILYYIYINFLPFLCGFSPRCWTDGGRAGSCSLRVASPGRAARGSARLCCPQRHFSSSASKIQFPLTVPKKSQAQRGHRAVGRRSWAPFSVGQFTCTVKMLVLPNPQTNIKNQNPKQSISLEFLWLQCPEVRGTLPAQSLLRGSLHLPYKKTRKQNSHICSIFHRSNQKKAGSFHIRVLSGNISKVLLDTQGSLQRSPLTEALWNKSLAFPQSSSPECRGLEADRRAEGHGSRHQQIRRNRHNTTPTRAQAPEAG